MPDISERTSDADVVDGRYRLRDEIGRGGMATVLRAHDQVLDRDVALKVLHGHLADDPAFLDRFRREARAAAALSHPNVVALYDWGENEDGSYMVLELIEGMSLREVLRIRGRLTPAEALALLGPAAAGLAAAHRAGLVHRDVKPENVLLGGDGSVKVTDFGLARAAASSTQTFGADVIVGSPHYLAPEAVHNRPVDARADVYALGVLLYEVLTGRPPYEGETPLATALAHTTSEMPAPSRQVPGLPTAVDDVVLTATAVDPDERYADAGEFADALAAAVPEGPSAVDLRDGRRNTMVIPVDSTDTFVAVGDGTDRTTAIATGEHTADGEDGPPRRRGRRLLALLLVLAALAGGAYGTWDRVIAPVTAVPSVAGQSEEAARAALEGEGFEVAVADGRAFSVEVPLGHVVRQEPAEQARRGSTVLLTLSAGPAQVDVPSLRGTPEEEALASLGVEGLEAEVERVFDEEIEAGRVVASVPAAGETVDEGSTVALQVSKGRRPITVPALRGTPVDAAVEELRSLGLEPVVAERVYHDEIAEGRVISSSPGGDEVLYRGDRVELTVSRGSEPFEMPDVRGSSEEDARTTLQGLGLEVEVEYLDTVFVFRRGRVDGQDPSPGRLVRRGDTVRLYVWQ